jgi:hypothetical protein
MNRRVTTTLAFVASLVVAVPSFTSHARAVDLVAPTYYVAVRGGDYELGTSCAEPDYWTDDDWSGGGDTRDGAAPGVAFNSEDDAIQDAIDNAISGSVVHICAGVYDFADQLEVDSGDSITLEGDGIDITILDGDDTTRIVSADGLGENDQGGTLTIVDLSIFDAHTANPLDNGGAIIADGLSLIRVQIAGSAGAYNGGALYAEGNVSIEDSAFYDNISSEDGAVLYAWNPDAAITVVGSRFESNEASGFAGAITASGDLQISDSIFLENESGEYGGAVVNTGDGSEVVIERSEFTDNNSGEIGGALVMQNLDSLLITRSSFTGNLANSFGGAMNMYNVAEVEVFNSVFEENEARGGDLGGNGNGGAIDACDIGAFTSISSRYISNVSTQYGGAIGLFGDGCASPGSINLIRNLFRDNSATDDGGALWLSGELESMIGNRFIKNHADGIGGAVFGGWWAGGELSSNQIERNRFKGNSAGEAGGALWLPGDIESLRRNTFSANRTEGDGGAVAINGLDRRDWDAIRGNLMFRNQADALGGAFYLQCSSLSRSSLQRLAGANRLSGNVARDSRRTSRIYQSGVC